MWMSYIKAPSPSSDPTDDQIPLRPQLFETQDTIREGDNAGNAASPTATLLPHDARFLVQYPSYRLFFPNIVVLTTLFGGNFKLMWGPVSNASPSTPPSLSRG